MDRNRLRHLHPPQTTTTTTTTTIPLSGPAVNRRTSPQSSAAHSTEAFPPVAEGSPVRPPTHVSQDFQPQRQAPPAPARQPRQRFRLRRSPSIGIRRIGDDTQNTPVAQFDDGLGRSGSGRRRSSSEPQRPPAHLLVPQNDLSRQRTAQDPGLPSLAEEGSQPVRGSRSHLAVPPRGSSARVGNLDGAYIDPGNSGVPQVPQGGDTHAPAEEIIEVPAPRGRNIFGFRRGPAPPRPEEFQQNEYQTDVVDMLDVIDPEVSTLSTLTNVQNSLFIPDLGRLVNRRPTYTLARVPTAATTKTAAPTTQQAQTQRPDYASTLGRTVSRIMYPDEQEDRMDERPGLERQPTNNTISSRLTDSRYAVLPHGIELEGWSAEDKEQLNDHVRHMLHSRRSKFKRSMKGFGQYVKRPLGFFITLYATLITIFGLTWVLFLIGWIYVSDDERQTYLIHIVDSVLVALFGVMGYGLVPFRTVDTYHMIFIAHYHHLTWSLRKKKNLPKLQDHNDLPGNHVDEVELEKANEEDSAEFSVLKPEQQRKLDHHAGKFAKSHTFYKPHETETHHAFPLRLLVAIVVLLDCHSLLQISLGATTWGIYYKTRPIAITTVILCCSITCNITAGILISIGDHRSRKKDVVERMFRQTLTGEALAKMARQKEEEEKEAQEKREREQRDLEAAEHRAALAAEQEEAEKRAAVMRAAERLKEQKRQEEAEEARKKEDQLERAREKWDEKKDDILGRFRPSMDETRPMRWRSEDEIDPTLRGHSSRSASGSGTTSPAVASPTAGKSRISLDERRRPGAAVIGPSALSRKSMDEKRRSSNRLFKPRSD